MKPFFLSKRPILPPGAAFRPETAVFRLKTAPPFGAGAALDAPGSEFRPTGASLAVAGAEFRRAGASLAVPGVAFRHAGASLVGAGVEFCRAGAALGGAGAAPIFQTEAPAAWSAAPFEGSAETPLRIGNPADRNRSPADKSVRAPLGAALDLAQPGTVNREPRTEPA